MMIFIFVYVTILVTNVPLVVSTLITVWRLIVTVKMNVKLEVNAFKRIQIAQKYSCVLVFHVIMKVDINLKQVNLVCSLLLSYFITCKYCPSVTYCVIHLSINYDLYCCRITYCYTEGMASSCFQEIQIWLYHTIDEMMM
jgi:hypothetical protein